jgi:D-cysteine desulfhydrase family pyridoxal phosphate-dependent enzyme
MVKPRAQLIQEGRIILLGHLPTPLEPMPRLRALLQSRWPGVEVPALWVKRDDMTGLFLGGNKTRKLEYLLAEARQEGADTLVTVGAPQSNHARQTAAAAAKCGLQSVLVLGGSAPKLEGGNYLLDQLLGAEVVWAGDRDRLRVMDEVVRDLQRSGRRPYAITYGGSNAVGAAAYVAAASELKAQCEAQNIFFSDLVVASSSGGTQAGLALGARMCWRDRVCVHGISIDQPKESFMQDVAALANDTAHFLGVAEFRFMEQDIILHDSYLGNGYGVVGALEQNAILDTARTEGLLLDPVYTARAMGGLFDLISKNTFSASDSVLFWHTGGAPAVFAYGSALLNTPKT